MNSSQLPTVRKPSGYLAMRLPASEGPTRVGRALAVFCIAWAACTALAFAWTFFSPLWR